ncbi:MAG TPA: thiamine pyrophosphate-binding protein [Candidatus Methylomirabilis sp.]|nr:thiamine pyrophosphate-binding protein [Candidatus Methylomirabilis sp.]
MTPAEIDVPHALVRVLEEAGIEFVFGMPGGDTGRIFDALYDSSDVRTILVRHEQTGSVMAEMYGRVTGKPGVVMGQGIFLACNALFGPLEAVKGASPMLVLGDFTDMAPFMHHAPYQAGTGEHGNHDLRNLFASVTKYTAAVSEPKQAVQTLQLAIKHATSGSPGPVAVVFSSRSLQGTVKVERPPRLLPTARYLAHGVTRPAAADVARVAEALLRGGSPVILAGNGVHASRGWAALARLAEAAGIPVATTATGKSAMAETHPLALGVFGNWGQAAANEVVSNADTVLVVGSRLSPTDTCFENPELLDADRQTFLQIDVEPLQIGRHYPVAAAIVADAREALEALAAEVEARLTPAHRDAARRRGAHLAELKGLHRYFAEPEQRSADVPLRPERVISELAARLGERALVTMDAGANRLYMTHYFQSRGAGTVYQPSSIGGMGYALPAALGAKLAAPDRDCVAVCGDGGFAMTMNALLTAAQHGIAVTTVVLNNGVLGWVKDGQRRRGNRFIASELGKLDYARMAHSMGCRGVRIESLAELGHALDGVHGAREPVVLDVVTTEHAPFWQVQSPFAKEGPGGE